MNSSEQTLEMQALPRRGRRPVGRLLTGVAVVLVIAGALALTLPDDGNRPVRSEAAGTTDLTVTTVSEPATNSTNPAPATTTPAPATTLSPTTLPERLGPGSRLRVDGVGPVRIGMTLDQARAASGLAMVHGEAGVCVDYQTDGPPAGLSFSAVEGSQRLDFVGVSEPSIATVSGIRVGSTLAEVRRTYGDRLTGSVQDGWGRLVFHADDPSLDHVALVFHFGDGKVGGMLSGLRSVVERDEICA